MGNRIKRINAGLIALSVLLIVSGTFIMLVPGFETLARYIFLGAMLVVPFIIAGKGIEFMSSRDFHKAVLSILVLCGICVFTILFIFV